MRLSTPFVIAALAFFFAALSQTARAQLPPKPHPPRAVQVVRVVEDRGFSWRDAGIGAAAAGFGIAAVAGGSLLILRALRSD